MTSKNDNVCREIEVVTLNSTVRIFSTAREDTLDSLLSKAKTLFKSLREGGEV